MSFAKDDMLSTMFASQRELMTVVQNRNGTTGTVPGNILAIIVEAAELANENGEFKWWKKNHEASRDKQLEELVDILFFLLQTAIKLDFSHVDIFKGYMKKWEKNIHRQRDNY